jgi:4-amino-4-deoxy-L-arabinose transferase-like glycosyltransferase
MAALSAVVFTLSGWLGWYLLARDPRKPVLALAAVGLCGFTLVVALDAVRTANVTHTRLLSQVEIYLVAIPSVAWFAVLVELSRPCDHWRARTREFLVIGAVGGLTLLGAMMAGSVDGPLRPGHMLMFAVISLSTLGAMIVALARPAQPVPVAGVV